MLFRRKRRRARWDLDTPILSWGQGATATIRTLCAGTAILGSTGAGKSTSSLRLLARSMLAAEFGGIFFTSKPDDTADYVRYVRETGRESDLRIISVEDRMLTCNFIEEEKAAVGNDPVMLAENLTALLLTLAELSEAQGSGGGGDNEAFFRMESQRLARNALLILALAGKLSIPNLHRLIVSAPQTPAQASSEEFRESSFLFECLKAADGCPKNASLAEDAHLAFSFFIVEWPSLSPRTRSVVQTVLTSTTDALSRGAARDILSSPTPSFRPADTYDGAIFIVDAPVLRYRETGRLIQTCLKACFQRAHARRDVSKSQRPTFMIADEYQLLAVDEDNAFQAISRSTRTAVVYATQSISGMLEAMGGSNAEPRVMSLLSNLQTKVVHQSTDSRTVQWFQNLVGKSSRTVMSASQSSKGNFLGPLLGDDDAGSSASFSEQMDFELQASDFLLATGGPPHWCAEALIYQGGRTFPSGRSWLRTAISQRG